MNKITSFLVTLIALGIMMPMFKNFIDVVGNTTAYATSLTIDRFVSIIVIAAAPWVVPLIFVIVGIINLTKKDDDKNIRTF